MTFALARLGAAGHERPFAIVDGVASSIESLTAEIDGAFLDGGGVERVRAALGDGSLPAAGPIESLGLRYGPPIARPGKVVCVGSELPRPRRGDRRSRCRSNRSCS